MLTISIHRPPIKMVKKQRVRHCEKKDVKYIQIWLRDFVVGCYCDFKIFKLMTAAIFVRIYCGEYTQVLRSLKYLSVR